MEMLISLEDQGYKWQYFIPGGIGFIPEDIGVDAYALITDEFPHGDILLTKKLINPRITIEHGIKAIGYDTKKKMAVENILYFFRDGSPIEVSSRDGLQAALVHPATRKDIMFQGSMFDEYDPYSHVEGNSQRRVVEQLIEYSLTRPDPGAVERIFRYRENPVSSCLR
ncbi:MAG: hypothetical protein Q8S00_32395 [Deltaproteobacteria bacterium]|nr:hypothetical protein [Deltaproteobacteria bacterium]